MRSAKRTVEAKPPAGQTVTGFLTPHQNKTVLLTLNICTVGTTSMEVLFCSYRPLKALHFKYIYIYLDMLC